jgi:3-hydroxybutyryl-CoA dehydrogenase
MTCSFPTSIIARAEAGKTGIAKALGRLVAKEKMTQADADALLGRITPVADHAAFAPAELVIEAATEREEIKRAIFASVGQHLSATAILASRTPARSRSPASLRPHPIRRASSACTFFNPVPVMGLIELIRGLATSDDTLAKVEAYGRGLGKEIVHANDAPGFIVNRVLMPMINEAIFALGEGVATMQDIDAGCRLGLNHPMGPITLADFIGLDTCLEIIRVLAQRHRRSEIPPRAAARPICRCGLGREEGRSRFLRLDGAGDASTDPLRRRPKKSGASPDFYDWTIRRGIGTRCFRGRHPCLVGGNICV